MAARCFDSLIVCRITGDFRLNVSARKKTASEFIWSCVGHEFVQQATCFTTPASADEANADRDRERERERERDRERCRTLRTLDSWLSVIDRLVLTYLLNARLTSVCLTRALYCAEAAVSTGWRIKKRTVHGSRIGRAVGNRFRND